MTETTRPEADSSPAQTTVRLAWWQTEDWLAVWLGFFLIALVLAGLRPALAQFDWSGADLLSRVLTPANLGASLVLGVGFMAVSAVGIALSGGRLGPYLVGFPVVYALAWCSLLLAGQSQLKHLGLEYVIFGLVLGLALSNTLKLPGWLLAAVRTEYFIKTGLVMLGANILFGAIMQAGALGIVQALLVVIVVWYACFWLCRRLRVDDEFAVMLSTAVSICGVSAAIAACGAIKGDRRKLSYVTSLVLIVAVPMMLLMPWIVKTTGIPELVGGAWMGGTLDTSGSVVAAGALISEPAMKLGVIVKFSQNVLIGVAAFVLSLWWVLRQKDKSAERPTVGVIWERFPKFVLGFLVASLVFSFLVGADRVEATKSTLSALRKMWFALAFVSIGLETRVGDLVRMENGRPALAFTGAQAFNVLWTLLISYLLFGGVLFASPEIE